MGERCGRYWWQWIQGCGGCRADREQSQGQRERERIAQGMAQGQGTAQGEHRGQRQGIAAAQGAGNSKGVEEFGGQEIARGQGVAREQGNLRGRESPGGRDSTWGPRGMTTLHIRRERLTIVGSASTPWPQSVLSQLRDLSHSSSALLTCVTGDGAVRSLVKGSAKLTTGAADAEQLVQSERTPHPGMCSM